MEKAEALKEAVKLASVRASQLSDSNVLWSYEDLASDETMLSNASHALLRLAKRIRENANNRVDNAQAELFGK